jgi:pimeloyl-ACP methyl ester carboxylesterase
MSNATDIAVPPAALRLGDINLELIDRGRGPPLLFLHPGLGIDPSDQVLDLLASKWRLLAPSHPGFGRSERPRHITTVDDLAYLYLDLCRSAPGLPSRWRSSRPNACRAWCSAMR